MWPRSDHFDGERFFNPGGAQAPGLSKVLRWKLTARSTPWAPDFTAAALPHPPASVASGVRATLVNHSTVLLQFEGCNLLTDPVWSERVSPFSWLGPKRLKPAGIAFERLPRIDLVLLSHNHYDHLDLPTVERLHAGASSRDSSFRSVSRNYCGPTALKPWNSTGGRSRVS